MSNPQHTPSPAPVGNPDDSPTLQALTPKQEAFCYALVETGNRALAYRRAYDIPVNTKPAWIWKEASELAQKAHVRAKVAMLMEAAASKTVANKAQLIKFLWERIHADRREVINHVRRCCRCCHGINHQHQWVDEMEYATELNAVMTHNAPLEQDDPRRKPVPHDEGGYGFDPHREPDVTCTSADCMGDGYGKTVIADTTKLEGAAALIYEGVKETATGIEILLAKRSDDIAQLSKLLGWSIDKVEGSLNNSPGSLPDEAYNIPSTSTPEEATRKYLTLIA
jgi:phage terminase small subunit